MRSLLIILVSTFAISSIGYSQYTYKMNVEISQNDSPKHIYSRICKRIDFTNRRVEGTHLFFNSENLYTQEKMESIVQLAGYELKSFKMSKNIEEIISN